MSYVQHVLDKISNLAGVLSADVGKIGEINVTLNGRNRDLREDILEIGKRAMLPIRVFYKLSDGTSIGEALEDYYKPLHVPGALGDTSLAPPEEVAAEPKGALKLKRLRGPGRGRPVVGWRYGEDEIRKGTNIKFKNDASLQWTMGRVLNVKPGASGKIIDLSTNKPMAYIQVGGYDSVELPIHSIGHIFDVQKKEKVKTESNEYVDNELGYKVPELRRLINVIGMGNLNYDADLAEADGEKNDDDYDYDTTQRDTKRVDKPEYTCQGDEDDEKCKDSKDKKKKKDKEEDELYPKDPNKEDPRFPGAKQSPKFSRNSKVMLADRKDDK
jgi:hypothetical protein